MMEENKVEYKIDYDVRMGIIINPYLMYGIMAAVSYTHLTLPTNSLV